MTSRKLKPVAGTEVKNQYSTQDDASIKMSIKFPKPTKEDHKRTTELFIQLWSEEDVEIPDEPSQLDLDKEIEYLQQNPPRLDSHGENAETYFMSNSANRPISEIAHPRRNFFSHDSDGQDFAKFIYQHRSSLRTKIDERSSPYDLLTKIFGSYKNGKVRYSSSKTIQINININHPDIITQQIRSAEKSEEICPYVCHIPKVRSTPKARPEYPYTGNSAQEEHSYKYIQDAVKAVEPEIIVVPIISTQMSLASLTGVFYNQFSPQWRYQTEEHRILFLTQFRLLEYLSIIIFFLFQFFSSVLDFLQGRIDL